MSSQEINGYTNEQTSLSDSDWFDIDAYLGVDDYESKKVSFGTIKNQILSQTSNVFNSDGTLTGDRYVFGDNKAFRFNNIDRFEVSGNLFNIGASGNSISSTSLGFFNITVENTNLANPDKFVKYNSLYSTGWNTTTDKKALVPLGFVTANGTTAERPTNNITGQQYYNTEESQLEIYDGNSWTNSEPSIQSKGNAIADFYHYSFSSGQDNDNFFNDGNIKLSWDTNGNDLELYMLNAPSGTGDLVSVATKGVTSTVSTSITQTNYKYDVYPAGVNASEGLIVWVSAELDTSYPNYKIFVHNAGSSYNSNVEVKVITPKQ